MVDYPEVLLRRYIIAQILGAYIACLFVYNQWKVLIDESEALLMAAGPAQFAATQFTPNGLPGIFVPYLLPEQTLPRAFMNEFVNVRLEYYQKLPSHRDNIFEQCTIIALIVWAAVDPTNYFVPPAMTPFVIAFA
jgi:hypothetical protein